MYAELRRIHCPEVFDLVRFVPDAADNFCLFLQIMVGPHGEGGEESFDVNLCTPKWMEGKLAEDEPLAGCHYIFVREFDYNRLLVFIDKYLNRCSGQNWQEVAKKVSKLGRWEFEDYQT